MHGFAALSQPSGRATRPFGRDQAADQRAGELAASGPGAQMDDGADAASSASYSAPPLRVVLTTTA